MKDSTTKNERIIAHRKEITNWKHLRVGEMSQQGKGKNNLKTECFYELCFAHAHPKGGGCNKIPSFISTPEPDNASK